MLLTRPRFALLALTTIALGLGLQRVKGHLPPTFGDVLGDILWAVMIVWLVGAALPSLSRSRRAGVALIICWIVECGQLLHAPWLDSWRTSTVGHLVLGSDFDARDLAAYAVGVAIAWVIERCTLSMSAE